ncbi:oligoendopeptidase F family protein [bacterium]|nr:oligoendopeptidase F family protein [bacterium]MCB2179118.1 oligoendopeptidase F family protein [bacterium]
MTEQLKRADFPPESKWQPEKVYPTWKDFEADFETAKGELPKLAAFKGKLKDGPGVTADFFDEMVSQLPRLVKMAMFSQFAMAVDGADQEPKAYVGQVMGLLSQFSATTAFSEPELLEIGDQLKEWTKEEPRLEIYAHYFDNLLKQKEYLRSAEVEEILGMLSEPFGQLRRTASELAEADVKFESATDAEGKTFPVTQGLIMKNATNPDRMVRRTAWENFSDGYLSHINTFASNYIAHVKSQVFNVRVRGYESVLESRLKPYSVPLEVFHNLLETFRNNLPTWHKYWDVKRQALGYENIYPYDIWAPLGKTQPKLSFTEAVEMVMNGNTQLGEEYTAALRKGCLEEHWVDWAPNDTKSQGAFSMPGKDNLPPLIKMSFTGDVPGLSTLSHELGHSMHAYFTNQHQPEIYQGFDISMTVAETASNLNQAMTRAYLRENKTDDAAFQLALVEEAMSNYHRYLFQMLNLATFELEVYTRAEQGKPLSAKILQDIMIEIYAAGYGDTMTDDPARTGTTWAQFSHLYTPFYTFQYAVGISAADALTAKIRAGEPGAAENYLKFICSGSSLYTMDLFDLAGVDMRSPEPVKAAFGVLDSMIDQLAELTK